jgi:hypothetical protein
MHIIQSPAQSQEKTISLAVLKHRKEAIEHTLEAMAHPDSAKRKATKVPPAVDKKKKKAEEAEEEEEESRYSMKRGKHEPPRRVHVELDAESDASYHSPSENEDQPDTTADGDQPSDASDDDQRHSDDEDGSSGMCSGSLRPSATHSCSRRARAHPRVQHTSDAFRRR